MNAAAPGARKRARRARTPVSKRVQIGMMVGVALTLTGAPTPAGAQTAPRGVPVTRPDQLPAKAPAARIAPRLPQARDAAAPIQPFVLRKVEVEGSTLPSAQLAKAYGSYIGRTVDNPALAAITTDMAAAYATSDVALYTVLVPEQTFESGTLRLVVVEGYVSGIEIRGKLRKSRLGLLQAYLRRLERERPLHTSTLQRIVSLIRDMPGVTAEPTFASGEKPGAVTLVVPVSEKPIEVAAGLNDRGTALLGRTQAQADILFNGIVAGGDQLRTTFVLPTHTARFQYYAGAYSAPLDSDGTSVTGNLSYLRTRPVAIPLKGYATSFGLQVTRAIIRRYQSNLYLTAGIDGIDTHNALLGYTLSNDRVRALRLASSYTTASKRNQLTLSATVSLGLDAFGARVAPGQSDRAFRKINGRLNDSVQIGRTFALRLNGFAQATRDDVPASEQIALGGDEFGRAYEAALITGDRGYAGSAELAWLPTDGLPATLKGSELYLFTDGGHVSYRSRLGSDPTSSHLASVGGGMRLHVAARTVLQIEGVRGLSNPVLYEDRKTTRLLFSIKSLL